MTSLLQMACGKSSFPSINTHTVNVVLASIGMAFQFILAMDMLNARSYYVGQELVCMPLTITDRY